MSNTIQRHDSNDIPPLPDEAYWAALLDEGEFAKTAAVDYEYEFREESILIVNDVESTKAMPHGNGSGCVEDWQAMEHVMQSDEITELEVVGYNRGGLLVESRSLSGFVPASQLTDFPTTASEVIRRRAMNELVGQRLKLRVIELNIEENRLILSERAAQIQAGERAGLLMRLQPDDVIKGKITNICDFGVFVDLGGVEGLIHISELSWGRVGHPSSILKPGQYVSVIILDVEREAGRIALSLKRLHPDPWETVNTRYAVGQIVIGKITNVVDFGAFACIEEGLEGLIHVSELAEGHFLHPRNVVQEGQQVNARVISIDSHARRLGLSLRLAL